MSDTNFTNEAPDVEEAIPTTTNGSSTRGGGGVSFTNTGESGEPHPESSTERSKYGNKRLSAASKKYDMDGDGELDEAEQASKFVLLCYVCCCVLFFAWWCVGAGQSGVAAAIAIIHDINYDYHL